MDDEYLIWSHEHAAWWGGVMPYTQRMGEARVFSRIAALTICHAAMPGTVTRMGALPELPVRRADAEVLLDLYRRFHPDSVEDWQ